LHYLATGNILAGSGTGKQKMAGYPANRNRISGTSLLWRRWLASCPVTFWRQKVPVCYTGTHCHRKHWSHLCVTLVKVLYTLVSRRKIVTVKVLTYSICDHDIVYHCTLHSTDLSCPMSHSRGSAVFDVVICAASNWGCCLKWEFTVSGHAVS